MHLCISPITEADVRAILTWRYPEPYALYSMASDNLDGDLGYFLDPANAFQRIADEQGDLIGFCSFGQDAQVPGGNYTIAALDIGLGMRPDLTGHGLGNRFLAAILDFASQQFAPARLRATVAAFNRRSQRVFERHSFEIVQRFLNQGERELEFVVMMKELEIERLRD